MRHQTPSGEHARGVPRGVPLCPRRECPGRGRRFPRILALLLDQFRHQAGPSRLLARTNARAGVAVALTRIRISSCPAFAYAISTPIAHSICFPIVQPPPPRRRCVAYHRGGKRRPRRSGSLASHDPENHSRRTRLLVETLPECYTDGQSLWKKPKGARGSRCFARGPSQGNADTLTLHVVRHPRGVAATVATLDVGSGGGVSGAILGGGIAIGG